MILLCLFVGSTLLAGWPGRADAQVVDLWSLFGGLMAPEGLLAGPSAGQPLPIRTWHSGFRRGTDATPVADPLFLLHYDPPLARFLLMNAIAYRTSRRGRSRSLVENGGTGISMASPLSADGWYLAWGGFRHEAVTRFPLPDDAGGFDRNPFVRHFWAAVRGAGPRWRALLAGGWLDADGNPAEWSAAIAWLPGSDRSISAWYSRTSDSESFDLSYKDAAASFAGRGTVFTYGLRATAVLKRWPIVLRLQDSKGSGRGPDGRDHRFRPRPRMRLAEITARSPGGATWISVGAGAGTHRAGLEYLDTRYGQFLIEDDRLWIRGGFHPLRGRRNWQLTGAYSMTDLNGEGAVALWPFTPSIVDLLGLRRIAVADGRLDLITAGVRGSTPPDGRWTLDGGLDLHQAWLDGTLVSWEPRLLGLGRDNILADELLVRSAQLVDLGASLRFRLSGALVASIGFTQLIPLAVQKRPRQIEPAPPGPPGPAQPRTNVEWGGLRFWFAIELPGAGD